MDAFLRRVTPPQKEPQAGLSGGLTEGTVIIEDDSAMCVISPEDLPLE